MSYNLTTVSIEITNRCNLNCVMCPAHNPAVLEITKNHPKYMSMEQFKEIIDQYVSSSFPYPGKSILPQFQGESLLHPKFIEMCRYADNKNLIIGFTTNGMLMNKEIVDELMTLKNLSCIAISIDGSNKEIGEKIRKGCIYETVVSNIQYLLSKLKSYNHLYVPIIQLSYTRIKENEEDIHEFLKQWLPDKRIRLISSAYAEDETFMPYKYYYSCDRVPCLSPTNFTAILTNGDVVPCCHDHLYQSVMGNVYNQKLIDIWNGEKYQLLRNLQLTRKWDCYEICKKCATWMCSSKPRCDVKNGIRQLTFPFHTLLEKI